MWGVYAADHGCGPGPGTGTACDGWHAAAWAGLTGSVSDQPPRPGPLRGGMGVCVCKTGSVAQPRWGVGGRAGAGQSRGPREWGRPWLSWNLPSGNESGPVLSGTIIAVLFRRTIRSYRNIPGSSVCCTPERLPGAHGDAPLLAHARAPHGSRGPGLHPWTPRPVSASPGAPSALPGSCPEISPFHWPPCQGPGGILPRNG